MFLKLFKFDRSTVAVDGAKPPAEPEKDAEAERATAADATDPAGDIAAAPDNVDHGVGTNVAVAAPIDEVPAAERFASTDELEPLAGPLGQEAALKALRLGAGIKGPGFHVIAVGASGVQPGSAVRDVLASIAGDAPAAADWVYVTDFERPSRRRPLRLPRGAAKRFADTVMEMVGELRAALGHALASDEHRLRRLAIEEEARAASERKLEEFTIAAAAQNVALLRTPAGYALAPMHDGKVVKPDVFQRLPEAMRRDVEARVTGLQGELAELLSAAPARERETRRRLADLEEETAAYVVHPIVAEAAARLADVPAAQEFLAALAGDVVRHAVLFTPGAGADGVDGAADWGVPAQLRRYLAAVVVTHPTDAAGAPVVSESEPTAERLVGSVTARRGADGDIVVKAGALHAANDGFLVLEGRLLVEQPEAWAQLKRALSAGEIAPLTLTPGQDAPHVEIEPIPLKLKVVLVADARTAQRLGEHDGDLKSLFGVTARFEDTVVRDAESETAVARLIAGIVREHGLAALDASAVDALIGELARLSGQSERLSLDVAQLTEIVREADYWSGVRQADIVGRVDIETALAERAARRTSGAAVLAAAVTEDAGGLA